MGEIADYHVDMYSSGKWGMPHRPKKNVTCNRCGKQGFSWNETDSGWRLFKKGVLHKCKKPKEV